MCRRGSFSSLLTQDFAGHALSLEIERTVLEEGDLMVYTMRDVAQRAGVSPTTVSRVLNNTHYISKDTKARVLDVVQELNYFKNVHARRLATGKSDLFGLVISDIANPFFPEVIRGFQTAAWVRGFDTLLM